jgi:hypothetical protein
MEGIAPVKQAQLAIAHALTRIHDHPGVGWYMGIGTESFALLTEAFAELTGQTVREVRERFVPENPADPAGEAEPEQGAECSESIVGRMDADDVTEYLAGLPTFDRDQLLRDIRRRFCSRCAGDNGAAGLPCQCNVGIHRKLRIVA